MSGLPDEVNGVSKSFITDVLLCWNRISRILYAYSVLSGATETSRNPMYFSKCAHYMLH